MNVPRWAPLVAVVLGGFALLVYMQHVTDPASTSWTDPHQPPAMVTPLMDSAGGRWQRATPRSNNYAPSLHLSSDCIVGDC